MKRNYYNIFNTVVPTTERNGGLLKFYRGLSRLVSLWPLSIDTIRGLSPARSRGRFAWDTIRCYSIDTRHNKPGLLLLHHLDKAQAKLEAKKVYSYGFPAFYNNFEADKDLILRENAGKAGIYMFTNKITKKKYIGKSSDLRGRFLNYFSRGFLEINKGGSLIYRHLLKFGFENFSLTILEYCPIDDLQSREQYFIDVLKPLLNIRKDVSNPIKPKISKKKSSLRPDNSESNNSSISQDEIINRLHRANPDLAEFKENIVIPLRVKEMMDLAESTNNPLGWRYLVDKEGNGHFAIWFLNNKTDQAFYGYSAYWKDGEIQNKVGFYELKAPQPEL